MKHSEKDLLDWFLRGFRDGIGGIRIECECGKTYYESDPTEDWDPGEFEYLEKAENAFPGADLAYITFEGKTYATDCDCWHKRAVLVAGFLCSHDLRIANFFDVRRRSLITEALNAPTINVETATDL